MKKSFKAFSKQFVNQDNPFGDLARDINSDKSFPNASGKDKLLSYLSGRSACDSAVQTFEEMYSLFEEECL